VDEPTGDALVEVLAALAHPIRLRIVATLAGGRDYVSHLARVIGISRPLLHMHLQHLEAAGLVTGTHEISDDGKAMRYVELTGLDLHLSSTASTPSTTSWRLTGTSTPARARRRRAARPVTAPPGGGDRR
jgi:ArsR family transcriptional regulator